MFIVKIVERRGSKYCVWRCTDTAVQCTVCGAAQTLPFSVQCVALHRHCCSVYSGQLQCRQCGSFFKEIYCTDRIYSVYKDKLHSCSCNQFE